MKPLKFFIVGAMLITAIITPWLVHRRAAAELRANEEALKKQTAVLAGLSVENEQSLNNAGQLNHSDSLSEAQLTEVLKLRNEIGQLRQSIKETESLQNRIRRLQDRLKDAAIEEANGREIDTAFLKDEIRVRQTRVERLKQWLEGMPQEKIPELQFVPDDRWTYRVDRPLVTDDDYRSAIGLLRADGEQKFIPAIFNALKQYAKANNGQFPSDVSQLKTYFKSPVDDAILQRYEIVPAKSLIKFLAEAGKEWVITQRSPVNKQFDQRVAISTTTYHMTGEEGRWDPLP